MNIIFVLLLGSALVGFMIAPRYTVCMMVGLSPILALAAATAALLSGFGLLASIAITFACVTISQMTYLLLMWLSMTHAAVLTDKPSDNHSRQNGQGKIHNKQTQQNKRPSHLAR